MFAPCSVNHSVPFLSKIGVCGSRAALSGIGYSVTVARFRVQLADERGGVAGVPDVPVLVGGQAVRARFRGLQREFLHGSGFRIEPAEHVRPLPGPPDGAIRRRERIVRPRAERGHHPLLDRYRDVAGDDDGRRLSASRDILGEIVGDGRALIRGHGQHRAEQVFPACRVYPPELAI